MARIPYLLIFLLLLVNSCKRFESSKNDEIAYSLNDKAQGNLEENEFYPDLPSIKLIKSSLPVSLADINYGNRKLGMVEASIKIESRIHKALLEYYFKKGGDSSQTSFEVNDCYLKTIELKNKSNLILYWVILKPPLGTVESEVLFFNQKTESFLPYSYCFNIWALYNENNKIIEPSNLRKLFEINGPEIRIGDFNQDGIRDYKFERLYHNGTANAIEKTVIQPIESRIDTLDFRRIWINSQ